MLKYSTKILIYLLFPVLLQLFSYVCTCVKVLTYIRRCIVDGDILFHDCYSFMIFHPLLNSPLFIFS